ncbi:hypothetical protein PILCRDRAFT_825047 [Piloderma croceum F 1598]|uniref:RING-type domain-containing protein n=1 Tax=Piloderma croceum (strain F 1598) TaxID=765440 RepID=A0A0C3EZ43_PILCF|nr:hypothetical protein PILCRDRAFT_825047 [Piloderma croceum F 1598]
MPLILQPTSSCDICMEDYNCDELARSPHSIDCGHIFCKTCIRGFTPKVCPLCRTPFVIGRRLHVDAVEGANPVRTMDAPSSALLERIALVSNESSTTEDVLMVVAEVSDWLSAHSNRPDSNLYKPLQLALDALCRYRSLRAVESSLRMQLQEEREAALLRHNKLQTDLKVMSNDLQVERGRFVAELWAEREASANVRKNFLDILREATNSIQTLRSEDGYLLPEPRSPQAKKSTGSIPSVHADPILKNTSHQMDVSSPQFKLLEGCSSSSLEDVIRELQGRCLAPCGKEQMHRRSPMQPSSFDHGALSFSRDKSATPSALPCIPKRSRQLLKMASSPSFRRNGDKCPSGTDRQGMGAGCTMQFQPDISGESLTSTPDVTTGMRGAPGYIKPRNGLTQRWSHPWKIFHSSGACV